MGLNVHFGKLFSLIWLAMVGGSDAQTVTPSGNEGGPVVERMVGSGVGEALSMAGDGGTLPENSSLLSKYWWMAVMLLPFLFLPACALPSFNSLFGRRRRIAENSPAEPVRQEPCYRIVKEVVFTVRQEETISAQDLPAMLQEMKRVRTTYPATPMPTMMRKTKNEIPKLTWPED